MRTDMVFSPQRCVPVLLFSLKLFSACLKGECRELSFLGPFSFSNKRLINHIIRTEQVPDIDLCELLCYQEPNCVSINYDTGTNNCELNSATHRGHDAELIKAAGFFYHGADSACDASSCINGGTCQSGFTDKRYRCLCPLGFTGEHCENDVDECSLSSPVCAINANCQNNEGSYLCSCKDGFSGDGKTCQDVNECDTGTHHCFADDECSNTQGSYSCAVPDSVAWFPLNATYATKEINNRTAPGEPSGISLARGPDGKANGSYQFYGSENSYIKFPNSAGGALNVRYSMTMLCWMLYDIQDINYPGGPLFSYDHATRQTWKLAVHMWVSNKFLHARFRKQDILRAKPILAGGWKFVGASYDNTSDEAKLWVDGAAVQTNDIGEGLELGTQGNVRMGARPYYYLYFKGRITQMQVYNLALTQEQIQTIQNRTQREG